MMVETSVDPHGVRTTVVSEVQVKMKRLIKKKLWLPAHKANHHRNNVCMSLIIPHQKFKNSFANVEWGRQRGNNWSSFCILLRDVGSLLRQCLFLGMTQTAQTDP